MAPPVHRHRLLLLLLPLLCLASRGRAVPTPRPAAGPVLLPPVADMVGLRVGITDKGLKYAATVALPLVLAQLSDLKIPDLPFDEDGFEGKVSSVACQNVDIAALAINANLVDSVALAATGLSIACTADWSYKLKIWPHVPDGSGTVSIGVGDGSAFSATLALANNSGVFTSLSLPACSASVHVSSLHFSGGLSGDILNLFKSLIESEIEKQVNSQVCSAVQTALVSELNPLLAKDPADYLACTVLGKSAVCDVSLGINASAAGPPPVPVDQLPVPDPTAAPTHELLLMWDMTPLNYLMWVVWDAGLLDVVVTPDMLPPSFPQILNTSNFEDIAPGMYKRWPNEALQLEVNVSRPPAFEVVADPLDATREELRLTLPTDILWQVRDPATGLQTAFTVSCPLTVGVAVGVEVDPATGAQSVNASVPQLDCTLDLVHSNVGNVSMDQLQGIIQLVDALVLPMVNQKLANTTLPLPPLGPVNLTNSEIAFVSGVDGGYLLVATDVIMGNLIGGSSSAKPLRGVAEALRRAGDGPGFQQLFFPALSAAK